MLSDYGLIKELTWFNEYDRLLSKEERLQRLQFLGDEAANYFRELLPKAFASYRNLVLLTHVPPFREACWHDGKISGYEWLPHFACKAVGDVLLEVTKLGPTVA